MCAVWIVQNHAADRKVLRLHAASAHHVLPSPLHTVIDIQEAVEAEGDPAMFDEAIKATFSGHDKEARDNVQGLVFQSHGARSSVVLAPTLAPALVLTLRSPP